MPEIRNLHYPTKEQIMEALYEPTEKEYIAVKTWKIEHFNRKWSHMRLEDKHAALKELVYAVCAARGLRREMWPSYTPIGEEWAYRPEAKQILAQTENPSIISALHELAHHLTGASETEACRFSIGIFIKCFPKTYAKLEWHGHMLKKPQ